jgi:hypothetical protein
MQEYEETTITGNIFAQELQNILQQRGLQLEDLMGRIGLHPGKVRQLRLSLQRADRYPVLSLDQMDLLIKELSLSEQEVARLHQVLPMLPSISDENHQHVTQSDDKQDFDNKRGGDPTSPEDAAFDRALTPVFNLMNQGNIALQMIDSSYSDAQRLRMQRKARDYFEEALKKLNRMPRDIQRNPEWDLWRQEVMQNLARII